MTAILAVTIRGKYPKRRVLDHKECDELLLPVALGAGHPIQEHETLLPDWLWPVTFLEGAK